MCLLYEPLSFAPERVKDTSTVLTIELLPCLTCPVCGQTCFPNEAAVMEHIRAEHPLWFWFWYWKYDNIPAGKILLGGTIAIPAVCILAALAKKK